MFQLKVHRGKNAVGIDYEGKRKSSACLLSQK